MLSKSPLGRRSRCNSLSQRSQFSATMNRTRVVFGSACSECTPLYDACAESDRPGAVLSGAATPKAFETISGASCDKAIATLTDVLIERDDIDGGERCRNKVHIVSIRGQQT